MAIGFETMEKQEMVSRYTNTTTNEFQEHFDIELALNGLSLGEVLQDQECIHQSLLENSHNDHTGASSSTSINDHGNHENFSQANRAQEHLSLDEALAWQLQGEEWETDTSSSEFDAEFLPPNNESNPSNSSEEATRQYDVDPDGMTYEERASLVEAVGNESRGLSDDVISELPIHEYVSRTEKNDKCAICWCKYKTGERRIFLRPCNHYYHANCIATWLKLNKICPMCKEEVYGP